MHLLYIKLPITYHKAYDKAICMFYYRSSSANFPKVSANNNNNKPTISKPFFFTRSPDLLVMLLLVALFSDTGMRELGGLGTLRGLALGISIFRLSAVEGGGDEDCEWTLEQSFKQDLELEAEPEEQMYAITPAGKRESTGDM